MCESKVISGHYMAKQYMVSGFAFSHLAAPATELREAHGSHLTPSMENIASQPTDKLRESSKTR